MALPLTETDLFLLLHAVGAPESRNRIAALLDLAGTGNMTGPASATDNALARYDGSTGALLQNSGALLSDAADLTGIASLDVASPSAATGTSAPLGFIKVKGTATTDGVLVIGDGVSANTSLIGYGNATRYKGYRSTGTAAAPGASAAGSLVNLSAYGYNGSAFALGGEFTLRANSTWTGSNHETGFVFSATPNGSISPQTVGTISGAGLWTLGTSGSTVAHVINGNTGSTFPTAGSLSYIEVNHSNNANTSSHAALIASVGGTAGGDPKVSMQISGGSSWSLGVKNASSDAFSISQHPSSLGTNEFLGISTAGLVTLGASGGSQIHQANGNFVTRYDNNGVTRLQVRNDNAGAGAFAQLKLSSDAGDMNLNVNSTAAGDSVSMTTDSTFGGGMDIGILGSNTLRLNTNATTALSISGAQLVTIGASGGAQIHRINGATVAANADVLTFTNGPTGTAGNPDIYLELNINGTNYVFPGFAV